MSGCGMEILVNGTDRTTLEEYLLLGALSEEELLDAEYALRLHGSYFCGNGDKLTMPILGVRPEPGTDTRT
jgi:hypothetical protein